MLLNLEQDCIPMKCVFLLSEELKTNAKRISLTQELTLNQLKPQMGLKGKYGLFGSPDWWKNIKQRKMPLLFLSGVICDAYIAGQDNFSMNNTIDLKLSDGSICTAGIYVNNKDDVILFRIGYRAAIVYALDELKLQPTVDGGVNFSKIALEMAVSLQPVE
ncbi:hypothetical protein [Photorhabdus heterorhabditis]|uniref:Uncharacterized protein n=1 Tax=Photorhabdus heterorhabditis TaxID=880156 RepID=A0A5B0WM08_9GAMM|nr:hypothetical protein [Photorhabdus heterorhabditis]KAA1187617.1 hypothetical protein F0L16_12540 [Photorhabdus heterorhabditis]KOY62567.1 hypothetical protein AM629_07790 [Photorhabdus heterorhabditis]